MSMPSDLPQLVIPGATAVDEAEAARCVEQAARMVQEFSAASAPNALDALLAIAKEAPAEAVEGALELAEAVAAQTTTLHGEVARFLSANQES